MAYADKLTTLQRFVAWKKDHNIAFEGVLIDEHHLVGRWIGNGYPLLSVDLTEDNDDFQDEINKIFRDFEWKIIDKPKQVEPRMAFQEGKEDHE